MTTAKKEILNSIRSALTASVSFDASHEAHHNGHGLQQDPVFDNSMDQDALVRLFCENLELVGGNVSVLTSVSSAAKAIESIVETGSKVAISDNALVKEIAAQLKDIQILEGVSSAELFDCDFGITSAQWAIAETGTLVLETGKEKNRLASLIPPVHIAVLDAKNIRQRMPEILKLVSENDLSRAVTFITGPSRTSDIELTLAIGVHGPAELHVIIIDEK